MTFQQLECVVAVAEEKSFSKAAKKLFISQPSLSQYIINIEAQIGVLLFDRGINPIKLTYAGEQFVQTAKKILELQNKLHDDMGDIANLKSGTLKIGMPTFRTLYFMPQVVSKFQETFPGIKLQLIEAPRVYLESECTKGNLDIYISTLPVNEGSICYEVVLEEKILLAVPPQFEINEFIKENNVCSKKEFQMIDLNLMKKQPFVLLKPEQNLHRLAMKLCKNAGFKPYIRLENGTIDSALAMVSEGIGIAFVSDTVVKHGQRDKTPIFYEINDEDACRSVVVAYKKNRYLSKAAEEFIKLIKSQIDII